LENNSETVNVPNEDKTQDSAASAAELVEESAPAQERAAVEATDEGTTGGASPADGEPLDPEAALQDALAQAEAQAKEYLDGWQRARAEFANYRRREEQRRAQAATEVSARVLGHFLPVLDDLERAFSSVPSEVRNSPWFEGLSLVAQKMLTGMEKEGVAVMDAQEGDAFDPNYHMAVLHSPCADYDEGQIAMVLQRGFTIGERVLRPAMVQVSSGKSAEDTSDGCECEQETVTSSPAETHNDTISSK
jgi:molecular chaperone GrpE